MTLRSARRAAREAYHRMAHIDRGTGIPDHGPERCEEGLVGRRMDIDATRLDAVMAAVAPILRRDGVQEHARRYGRRTVQFTEAERATLLATVHAARADLALSLPLDRRQRSELAALTRVEAKLRAVGS